MNPVGKKYKFIVKILRANNKVTTYTQTCGTIMEAIVESQREHRRTWSTEGMVLFAELQE